MQGVDQTQLDSKTRKLKNSQTRKLKNSKTEKLANWKTRKLKNWKTRKLENSKTRNQTYSITSIETLSIIHLQRMQRLALRLSNFLCLPHSVWCLHCDLMVHWLLTIGTDPAARSTLDELTTNELLSNVIIQKLRPLSKARQRPKKDPRDAKLWNAVCLALSGHIVGDIDSSCHKTEMKCGPHQ